MCSGWLDGMFQDHVPWYFMDWKMLGDADGTHADIEEARLIGPNFLRALMVFLCYETDLTQILCKNRICNWDSQSILCLFVSNVVDGGSPYGSSPQQIPKEFVCRGLDLLTILFPAHATLPRLVLNFRSSRLNLSPSWDSLCLLDLLFV